MLSQADTEKLVQDCVGQLHLNQNAQARVLTGTRKVKCNDFTCFHQNTEMISKYCSLCINTLNGLVNFLTCLQTHQYSQIIRHTVS